MVSKIMKFQTVEFKFYIYYFLQMLISKQRLIEFKRNGSKPWKQNKRGAQAKARAALVGRGQAGRLAKTGPGESHSSSGEGHPVASRSGWGTGKSAGTDGWRAGKGWRKETADASGEWEQWRTRDASAWRKVDPPPSIFPVHPLGWQNVFVNNHPKRRSKRKIHRRDETIHKTDRKQPLLSPLVVSPSCWTMK